MINIQNNSSQMVGDVYVRCIAHVVNFGVKESLTYVHEHFYHFIKSNYSALLQAMKSSVKQSEIYEFAQKQLYITISIPYLDVVTWWSSIFTIVTDAYRISAVCNNFTSKVHDLN